MWDDGDMGLPQKYLGQGETQILHLRTHGKKLIAPAIWLLVVAGLLGLALAQIPATWPQWVPWVAIALAIAAWIFATILPFLRWFTTTYTLTDRRIITRKGIINKSGHDLPLSRINNVAYDRSFLDRILGCGTLVLTTAAEAPVLLDDIPDVEHVHVLMTELLFADENPPDKDE